MVTRFFSLCALLATLLVGASAPTLSYAQAAPDASQTLTFEQALDEAAANTEAAEMLELDVRAAVAREDMALGELLPVLSASATGVLNQEEVTAGQQTFVNQFDYSASLDLSVDLFRGPAIAEYMATSHEVEAARQWSRWDGGQLRLIAGRAYLDALTGSRNVQAALDSLALSQATLEQAEILLETGFGVPADVARAELGVTEAELAVLEAERTRDNALDALAWLTGRVQIAPDALVDPGLAARRDLAAIALESSIERDERADLLAIDAEIEASDDRLLGRWLAFLPVISLRGQYQFGRPTFRAPDGAFWSVSVTATWVIFDYVRYGALDLARVNVERSELVVEETERSIDRDVRSARRQVLQADRQVVALEQAVETAQQARELILLTYQGGDATVLELTEADTDVLSARTRLNLARLRLDAAWLELDWIEGRLATR